MSNISNKPLVTATLQELREMIESVIVDLNAQQNNAEPAKQRNLVYGIAGIAKIFGCSLVTAQRIKSEGTIDGAISQIGDIIVVDVDKALELTNIEVQKRKTIGKRSRYTLAKK